MGTNLIFLCALGGSLMVPEQSFFGGRSKSAPTSERIKELLQVLKTSGDEGLRLGAVDELRLLDTQSNAAVVAALVETMQTDRKPGVRAEAAVSLARMRPVRPDIGHALEHTIAKDSSMRVRMQARSALLQYNLAGFRSSAPMNNSPAQLDPLGEIARAEKPEAPASPARPWSWMAFQNNWFGPTAPAEANSAVTKQPANGTGPMTGTATGPATGTANKTETANADAAPTAPDSAPSTQPAAEPRSWYRPGKALAGWFQSTFGSQRAEPKETGSPMPPISPAGLNVPGAGAPGRTVSNSARPTSPTPGSLTPSGTPASGSRGNPATGASIPTFPPVPEFQPGSPSRAPEPKGPELGTPDR